MQSPRRTDSRFIVYKHSSAERCNGIFCEVESSAVNACVCRDSAVWSIWEEMIWISICGKNSSQRVRGRSGAAVQRVAIKWFLKVLIARSALRERCVCGGQY